MDIPRTGQQEFCFLYVFPFVLLWLNDLTFGRCQKLKKAHSSVLIPGFSILKRDIWVLQVEIARLKILKKSVWILYSKRRVKIVCCSVFNFVFARETACEPKKNITFGIGWTCVARSTWDFFETKYESHKYWNSNTGFLLDIRKTSFQNFRSSNFKKHDPKVFSSDKDPGKLHVTFCFSFRNDQKLAQWS